MSDPVELDEVEADTLWPERELFGCWNTAFLRKNSFIAAVFLDEYGWLVQNEAVKHAENIFNGGSICQSR